MLSELIFSFSCDWLTFWNPSWHTDVYITVTHVGYMCFFIQHYICTWLKTPTVPLIWAKWMCQILTQSQPFCFYSHKEDKHPQQSKIGRSKASSVCMFTSICFGMPLFPPLRSPWKQCGVFHKLTIKHSWFCFAIISIWCQADCNVEATTFI